MSIPSGTQDTVWDPSTCLIGQMSSCFALHDTLTDVQARLIYELGPNQFSINWLDLTELNDLKTKFVFHYDAKCSKDLNCIDLSFNKLSGKFSGEMFICNNFRESLNSIGSVQIFYPLLNYLSSNQEYYDLVVNEWASKEQSVNSVEVDLKRMSRKSSFDDSEIERNVVAFILNLFRYLFHNNDILQDRLERNNGIALLSFLIQRLPKRFIDINLLRMCQEFVTEANKMPNKNLILSQIYEHLIFDFRIWNKSDYEIRIGHIQYISTIIKDDKKYFRKKYGVQFFLDVIKTYFGKNSQTINNNLDITENGCVSMTNQNAMNDEDLRNLRNSFFGLIKYYAQKEIKINELNAIILFLSTTRNPLFQNDLLDMLISLLEAPNANDQLTLLLFEPNLAESFYALITQPDVAYSIQAKLLKLMKILLKTKKVYDKYKNRLKLDDCGGYSGLVSKISSEYWFSMNHNKQTIKFNEQLVVDLLNNFLYDELVFPVNYESVWHIISLLTVSAQPLISDINILISIRLNICKIMSDHLIKNPNSIKLLTKCIAWQDILCQLLCIEKKHHKAISTTNEFVSTPKYSEHDEFETTNEDYIEDTSDWENLEFKEDDTKLERIGLLASGEKKTILSKTKSIDPKSLITSTPSPEKPKNNLQRQWTDSSDDQNDFNKKLSTKTQSDAKITSTLLKKAIKNSVNEVNSIRKILVYIKDEELSDIQVNNKNEEINKDYLETEETKMLCESMLDLIFKLLWEGVPGSNEDAWKVIINLDFREF